MHDLQMCCVLVKYPKLVASNHKSVAVHLCARNAGPLVAKAITLHSSIKTTKLATDGIRRWEMLFPKLRWLCH